MLHRQDTRSKGHNKQQGKYSAQYHADVPEAEGVLLLKAGIDVVGQLEFSTQHLSGNDFNLLLLTLQGIQHPSTFQRGCFSSPLTPLVSLPLAPK